MRSEFAASASRAVGPWLWTPSENCAWSGTACTVPVPVTVIPPGDSEAPPARSGRPTPANATTAAPTATSAAIRIGFMTAPFAGRSMYAAKAAHVTASDGGAGERPGESRTSLGRREPAGAYAAPDEHDCRWSLRG